MSEDDFDSLGEQLFEWHDRQQQRDNGGNSGNEESDHIIGRKRNGTHLTNNCKAVTEISEWLYVTGSQRRFIVVLVMQPFLIKIHDIRRGKGTIFR
jgi:hypothetical protein